MKSRGLKEPVFSDRAARQANSQRTPKQAKTRQRAVGDAGAVAPQPPQSTKPAQTKPKLSPEQEERISAIREQLRSLGLDEASLAVFVKKMWGWLLLDDRDFSPVAARILGKAFISEKQDNDKPEELPLRGLDDAIKSMLGSTVKVPDGRPERNAEPAHAEPKSGKPDGPRRGPKDPKYGPN